MNRGLFGASFDPPHLGHAEVVEQLIKTKKLDQIFLIPTRQHPLGKRLSPASDRLAMVELMMKNLDLPTARRVQLSTYELDRAEPSYSYDTLTAFRQHYPEDQLTWIIGSDNIDTFHLWYRYQDILKEFPVAVYPRPGYSTSDLLPGMHKIANVPEVAISSTLVRERIEGGESINDLVTPAVAGYIQEHGLYDKRGR
jgi:nicotinate-nucleotide adenylyltransferase